MNKLEECARALARVRYFSRFNDFTRDRVDGLPIEICRYGDDDSDPVVIARFPAGVDEDEIVRKMQGEERVRAVIRCLIELTSDESLRAMLQSVLDEEK